jgi:hypothetical protein
MNRNGKKVISIIFGALCAIAFISAAAAQTAGNGEWSVYSDGNEGGKSVMTITQKTETIGGRQVTVYELKGEINDGAQYPYAGVTFNPDAATLALLRKATGVTFKIVGDGARYGFEAVSSTVTDYAYHWILFPTTNNAETTVTITFRTLRQPEWGRRVTFNAANIDKFNIFTNKSNFNKSGAFTFKIYDLQIQS